MNAGERYAVAVLRETTDRLVSEGRLTPLQSYTFRLFTDEAEKCIGSPTADPDRDIRWRLEITGRALDAAEVTQ